MPLKIFRIKWRISRKNPLRVSSVMSRISAKPQFYALFWCKWCEWPGRWQDCTGGLYSKAVAISSGLQIEFEFFAQNIKCDGCASAIRAGLDKHPQVRDIQVEVPTGRVAVQADGDVRPELAKILRELGYPERT